MLKKILVKYLGTILVIATIGGLGYFAYLQWQGKEEAERKHKDLIGVKDDYEQLSKYVAKLETKYEKQKKLHKRAKKEWKKAMKEKQGRIRLLSDATYLLKNKMEEQDSSDYLYESEDGSRSFVLNELRIQGRNSPPIGYIIVQDNGKIFKENYEFKIKVKNLQTVNEDSGKIKVYSKAFLIPQEGGLAEAERPDLKNWKGVKYPLPIVDGVTYIDPTQPGIEEEFHLWAPHVNGGFNLGASNGKSFLKPEINVSLSGYGKTKNDLDWKFLHLGVGMDTEMKNPDIHFMPFTYRPVPSILSNTYLGPGIGMGTEGTQLFFNTSVTF